MIFFQAPSDPPLSSALVFFWKDINFVLTIFKPLFTLFRRQQKALICSTKVIHTGDDEDNGVVVIIGVTVGVLLVLIPLVVACVWFGTKKYDQLQEERCCNMTMLSQNQSVRWSKIT